MFSQGQLLLSHMCSCLSIHSTCALLCIGKWSVLGLVKDSNVRSCLTGDKVGKDNSWPRSWARSQPRPAVGSQAKPVPKKSSQLPKAQASILASSTHWPWLRPLFWQAVCGLWFTSVEATQFWLEPIADVISLISHDLTIIFPAQKKSVWAKNYKMYAIVTKDKRTGSQVPLLQDFSHVVGCPTWIVLPLTTETVLHKTDKSSSIFSNVVKNQVSRNLIWYLRPAQKS